MTQSKDGGGFFRRVAKFVSNPATQWGETPAPKAEVSRESEAARSELKEMIERKRRNDFVRKSELDLLRKLRREGLSSEQLATLGRSSGAADSDIMVEPPVKAVAHVKSKIDAIEEQISAETRAGGANSTGRDNSEMQTERMALNTRQGAAWVDTGATGPRNAQPTRRDALPTTTRAGAPLAQPREAASSRFAAAGHWGGFGPTSGVEVSEARHDPEMDAAVIAFANADFAACEQALQSLITAGGDGRNKQPATWLVLFDFYRAIGQQVAFENLAGEFSALFGTPAPRWRSIPQAIADVQRSGTPRIHWPVPAVLDAAALAQLPARTAQWSQPWIIDWRDLERVDPTAEPALATLFDQWSSRRIDMRWLGGERLLACLSAAAPAGMPSGSRACWETRLTVMRMLHQPARFDDVAIDYASTYRCAAPAWERSLCRVRLIDSLGPRPNGDSTLQEATTAFVETTLLQQDGQGTVAEVELSGELVGDIGPLLRRIDSQVEDAQTIVVSCHHLVRVDFLASGDLLNWVITKDREQRQLSFVAAQRLVAMFFAAMGIDEYARVTVDEG